MKNIFLIITLLTAVSATAQDFNKDLASARTAYNAGNLEDARFAMQQMLTDIDLLVGKEILKILPTKMDMRASNPKADNVTANTGLTGVLIHRDYGTADKTANIEIMGNSPLVASINAILSIPFVGNSSDGTQKIIKVQGYKAVLQKTEDTETNKTDYTLQLPLNSTLITFTAKDISEADMVKLANTIPVTEIAKMVQ
ncbi:hypothetical protein [Pseudochryseolinea flava]|uniref:DUF4251 domain-containing protein n=1 Tax=Pseudochryseolinea flava TaxID=2059302 RepID=A0A364Y851_9BACT|nr:hypothetical protein [Pseudochryseolinea flava]RAW03261.1 hypothetical protein DQQ10_04030 [Pseudochryseolinea flava]